jgi:hypothetical protein
MAHSDVLELGSREASRDAFLKNTVLAQQTAPVLILNMHLAGRIASCSLMRTFRAVRASCSLMRTFRAVRATGLFALQDSVSLTSKICVYDGVPTIRTLEVMR